ncbi:MAG TPA: HK97-gp10 family putative phage morphogenesis protein [Cellvibrio sp.]|nr:HK97-gp10 family putative phage morphogenesis protein [Cellvibrio sp.]
MAEQVGIRGLEELKKTLNALPQVIGEKVIRSALTAAAKPIREEAKAKAPVLKDPDPRRKPGTIQKNIVTRKSKQDKYGVYVGVKALKAKQIKAFKKKHGKAANNPDDPFYWIFSEFGTSKMPAAPFLRPAFESKKYEALQKFENYSKKHIVKQAEKLAKEKGMKK